MATHLGRSLLLAMLGVTILAAHARAQAAAPAAPAPAGTDAKSFKPEELEALTAPVALYPDAVLAQVLMASTYPLEVVQAERWVAGNKALKGDALAAELEKKDWDPSVKSLVNFPQTLTMMSQDLEWTTKLGDAFIADQQSVMYSVQRLRTKAEKEGNLKTTPEQKVIVEQAPPQTVVVQTQAPPPPQIITIESPSPEVVYVPTYNPTVVYGAWPYPAYPPPPPYYPPGYVASNLISFGAGVAVGAAWGYAWGGCHWGHGEVDIDVDRNANINRNINRESYRQNIQRSSANVNRQPGQRPSFQHDPSHRKGVSYRDNATANRMARPGTLDAAKARESFRGRADAGRADIGRNPGISDRMNTPGAGNRPGAGGSGISNTPRIGDNSRIGDSSRGGSSPRVGDSSRVGGGGNTPSFRTSQNTPSPSRGGAFEGADRSGSAARASSNRGQASRSSPAPRPSASPSRSAPQRSSGGASRSGGVSRGGGASRGGGRR